MPLYRLRDEYGRLVRVAITTGYWLDPRRPRRLGFEKHFFFAGPVPGACHLCMRGDCTQRVQYADGWPSLLVEHGYEGEN